MEELKKAIKEWRTQEIDFTAFIDIFVDATIEMLEKENSKISECLDKIEQETESKKDNDFYRAIMALVLLYLGRDGA